jgi:hypothetical protein
MRIEVHFEQVLKVWYAVDADGELGPDRDIGVGETAEQAIADLLDDLPYEIGKRRAPAEKPPGE